MSAKSYGRGIADGRVVALVVLEEMNFDIDLVGDPFEYIAKETTPTGSTTDYSVGVRDGFNAAISRELNIQHKAFRAGVAN